MVPWVCKYKGIETDLEMLINMTISELQNWRKFQEIFSKPGCDSDKGKVEQEIIELEDDIKKSQIFH